MKRYSKSHHTTLSEINITPLLDLAFVLLVIFVITTTPLVKDVDLSLPSATLRPKDSPRKPNYVSLDRQGHLFLNMEAVDLASLRDQLIELRSKDAGKDSDLSVVIRGDGQIRFEQVKDVLEMLKQANILKVSLATDPLPPGS